MLKQKNFLNNLLCGLSVIKSTQKKHARVTSCDKHHIAWSVRVESREIITWLKSELRLCRSQKRQTGRHS